LRTLLQRFDEWRRKPSAAPAEIHQPELESKKVP